MCVCGCQYVCINLNKVCKGDQINFDLLTNILFFYNISIVIKSKFKNFVRKTSLKSCWKMLHVNKYISILQPSLLSGHEFMVIKTVSGYEHLNSIICNIDMELVTLKSNIDSNYKYRWFALFPSVCVVIWCLAIKFKSF